MNLTLVCSGLFCAMPQYDWLVGNLHQHGDTLVVIKSADDLVNARISGTTSLSEATHKLTQGPTIYIPWDNDDSERVDAGYLLKRAAFMEGSPFVVAALRADSFMQDKLSRETANIVLWSSDVMESLIEEFRTRKYL